MSKKGNMIEVHEKKNCKILLCKLVSIASVSANITAGEIICVKFCTHFLIRRYKFRNIAKEHRFSDLPAIGFITARDLGRFLKNMLKQV